jgi:hypothetical protein
VVEVIITGPNHYRATTNYDYDAVGNLLKVKQQTPNGTTVIERTYDDDDNILTETVVLNGTKLATLKQEWRAERRMGLQVVRANEPPTNWRFDYNAAAC